MIKDVQDVEDVSIVIGKNALLIRKMIRWILFYTTFIITQRDKCIKPFKYNI